MAGAGGAAALLGLKASTLASRLKALEIHRPDPGSLYVRLGSHRGISVLARELFGRVLSDPELSRFWEHRSNIGVLREEQLLIAYLSACSGGPARYAGRDMRSAHRGLGITAADWRIFWGHLGASLEALRVPHGEQDEIEAFADGLRGDIVAGG